MGTVVLEKGDCSPLLACVCGFWESVLIELVCCSFSCGSVLILQPAQFVTIYL